MLFELKVFSEANGLTQIQVEADSAQAAEASAGARGFVVLQVLNRPAASRPRFGLPGAHRFPLLQFSQQLHGLLRAGLGLVEALEALEEKEASPEVRPVLQRLLQAIRHGQSLSQALEQDPASFPPFYVASLKASERSGDVAESLGRFIGYQQQIDSLRKQVVTALVYPALLMVAGSLVTLFLLGYVVPKFSRIYESRPESLPFLSRLMVQWGQFVSQHPGWVAGGLLAGLALLAWGLSRPGWRRMLSDRAWRLPWLGERLRTWQLSRLFRTLSMLLHGGTPMASALELVPGLLHAVLRPPLAAATARIREGSTISQAFLAAGLTTPVAYRMLRVGERSGAMADMMQNIAVFYDEETENDIRLFTRIFEPLMMGLIGIMVGGIVIIMYMPIFDLAGSIQ